VPTLDVKAFMYIVPVKATATVVDSAFHAMGDVNWDGYIDATDLDLMKAAYGSRLGTPNWNPDADLNEDGIVNMHEVVRSAINYGKHAPEFVTPFATEVAVGKCVVQARYRMQKLKVTVYMAEENRKSVIFIFSPLGLFGRGIVR